MRIDKRQLGLGIVIGGAVLIAGVVLYLVAGNRSDAPNPLAGEWREESRKNCQSGEFVEPSPDARIGELIFRADGTFSVTWIPFETYVDYVGQYTFNQDTHRLTMQGRIRNYFPPDFDGEGTFEIDAQGRLILQGIWLGTGARTEDERVACGHRFIPAN